MRAAGPPTASISTCCGPQGCRSCQEPPGSAGALGRTNRLATRRLWRSSSSHGSHIHQAVLAVSGAWRLGGDQPAQSEEGFTAPACADYRPLRPAPGPGVPCLQALLQEGDADSDGEQGGARGSAIRPGARSSPARPALPLSTPLRLAAVQVGLDAAGKTTILYKLKLGEIVTTIPTIGAWLGGAHSPWVGPWASRRRGRSSRGCGVQPAGQGRPARRLNPPPPQAAGARRPPAAARALAPSGLPVPCFLPCLPPAGFNVETVEYKNISFTVWDVGGQDKVSTRPPAAHSCARSSGGGGAGLRQCSWGWQ
jgi:hypothetical protein